MGGFGAAEDTRPDAPLAVASHVHVGVDYLGCGAAVHDASGMQPHHLAAQAANGVQVVAHQDQCLALGEQFLDLADALALEVLVADRQHLVDEHDVVVHVGGDGEAQAKLHAGRVGAHREVDEVLELGELDDLREDRGDPLFGQAHDRAAEADVLAAREVRVKGHVQVQQAGSARAHLQVAFGGGGDAREQPQQRGLAGAVGADHAKGLAPRDREVDVPQRPELDVVLAVAEELPDPAAVRTVDVEALAEAARDDRVVVAVATALRLIRGRILPGGCWLAG